MFAEWGAGNDSINQKFTAKERDSQSGLDYFGARYYGSGLGRCVSPDWSAKEEKVPYAKLDNPQSLNLYVYALNNPIGLLDPGGHDGGCAFFGRVGQAISATAADFGITESSVRQEDNVKKSGLDSVQRDSLRTSMQQRSTPVGREIAEDHTAKSIWSRLNKDSTQLAESVERTNPKFNAAANIAGKIGPLLGVLAVGVSAYNIATAPAGERGRVASGEAVGLVGSVVVGRAGQALGVALGSESWPGAVVTGAVVGVGGSIVGNSLGRSLGEHLYDAFKQ